MTDAEITAVIQGLHPDLNVGELELRVSRAIAQAERERWTKMVTALSDTVSKMGDAVAAERERCAKIAEIEHMTPKDIARVIRSNYPSD